MSGRISRYSGSPAGQTNSGRDAAAHQPRPDPCRHPVDHALDLLEVGLLNDLSVVIGSEHSGVGVNWDLTCVIGELPVCFRSWYTTPFIRRLVAAAQAFARQRPVGEMSPGCLAQFILARWVLDRSEVLAGLTVGPRPHLREDLAAILGLTRSDVARPGCASASDPWGVGWTIQSIRADPSTWFVTPFRQFQS